MMMTLSKARLLSDLRTLTAESSARCLIGPAQWAMNARIKATIEAAKAAGADIVDLAEAMNANRGEQNC